MYVRSSPSFSSGTSLRALTSTLSIAFAARGQKKNSFSSELLVLVGSLYQLSSRRTIETRFATALSPTSLGFYCGRAKNGRWFTKHIWYSWLTGRSMDGPEYVFRPHLSKIKRARALRLSFRLALLVNNSSCILLPITCSIGPLAVAFPEELWPPWDSVAHHRVAVYQSSHSTPTFLIDANGNPNPWPHL